MSHAMVSAIWGSTFSASNGRIDVSDIYWGPTQEPPAKKDFWLSEDGKWITKAEFEKLEPFLEPDVKEACLG